jgi:hypothetical protein
VMKNLTRLATAISKNSRDGLTRETGAKKWAKDQELSPDQRHLLEDLFPHLRLKPPNRYYLP